MAERIQLTQSNEDSFNESVETALRYLRAGEVIIAAAEHGYVYLANAFDKDAVNAIHILRGNSAGTTLQVFVKDKNMAKGVTAALTLQQEGLLDKFWPGLLSVTIKSQPGLTWNLGDDRRLGKVNLRSPKSKFISAILEQSGPLATSSAAFVGKPTVLDLATLAIYESDIGAIFDEGLLTAGPLSTWVEFSENEITLQRVGAITVEQLRARVPTISAPNL
jgi:tRNA threonylcarbamoyl adenosine modification protein (Sua5/YciO/YrdC/YwlC family)